MRRRLVDHRWLWLAVAVIAIVANEVFDHATNSGSHPVADLLIAASVVALAAWVWEFAARGRSRRVS